jgi:O-antigen/teichoic acid export membrane protein
MGRYALGVAWAAPVMLASRMQLRYVLAADAGGRLAFEAAAGARAVSTLGALALIAVVAGAAASPATAHIVALVAAIRAAEDAGDLLLGLAQRAGDWVVIARSLALRGLGGAAAFAATLAVTPRLTSALFAALGWQAGITLLHDWPSVRGWAGEPAWPAWQAVWRALRDHASLGAAAALVSLNAYVPRYAVERFLGVEAVGVFTALAQLALAGNMAVQAVGQAAVAPLGQEFLEDSGAFRDRVRGLLAFALAAGGAGMALAACAGGPALALLYRPEYARYGEELIWLMAAAALTYVTAILGYALVATGERRAQVRIFAFSAAVALAASLAATPAWGLRGAAAALLASWLAAAGAAAVALALRLRAWRRPSTSPKLNPWKSEPAQPDAVR